MEAVKEAPPARGRLTRVVSHPDQLKALSVLPLMRPWPRGRLVLRGEGLAEEARARWEKDLNRAYGACGCGEASLGLMAGVLGGLAWLGFRAASGGDLFWRDGLWLLLFAVVGQGLGKMAGLVRAQGRLSRLTAEVARAWTAPPREHSHDACG